MIEAIFLYIILHDDNSEGERFRTKMPNMEVCMAAVSNAKVPDPASVSGDYEAIAVMWCGGEFERHYGSSWRKDKD